MPRTLQIFENTNHSSTYFYPAELSRMDPTYNQLYPAYFEFYLYRSGFTETYRRYYPRIDSMIAEIFGITGLISLLFAIFVAGYNRWLFGLHLKQSINKGEHDR